VNFATVSKNLLKYLFLPWRHSDVTWTQLQVIYASYHTHPFQLTIRDNPLIWRCMPIPTATETRCYIIKWLTQTPQVIIHNQTLIPHYWKMYFNTSLVLQSSPFPWGPAPPPPLKSDSTRISHVSFTCTKHTSPTSFSPWLHHPNTEPRV